MWVQGRQFLIGGQAHPWREVPTTFELWFKGTIHARQVYGGWKQEGVVLSSTVQFSISVFWGSKRFLMGRCDQNWIMDQNDSSKFKVFGSLLNLSDRIGLIVLILAPWMVWKTYIVWRSYHSLKSLVNYKNWTLTKFDLEIWEIKKRIFQGIFLMI